MNESTNPKARVSPLTGVGRPTAPQKTVLLGDLPEAPQLMLEPSALPAGPITAHLTSQALTALSGRYEILGEAGHGSMGNVYKARDRETGETVALKLLKPEIASDQAMMDRFKNELLFARKITHKNVCRVYEFNRVGGIAYTSMEFVEGESLRSVLNRFGGLPVRKTTDLVLQICSGLKEAHAQGIIHRDLKPENVMIDVQGNVKIMDFGIARSMEAGTRLTGSMVGTPAYMAPEQVTGKPVDYRTDVYSLGLIMYEVFTGAPAFQADNAVAVALKQMRESPTPPHEIDPNIPVSIERAILKCIEKEAPRRFQSVGELESVLRGSVTQNTAAANLADISFNRRAQGAAASQAPHSLSVRKKTSVVGRLLLLVVLVPAALGVLLAAQIEKVSESLHPPAALPAPAPPSFALDIPVAEPATAEPDAVDSDAPQADDAKPAVSEPKSPAKTPAVLTRASAEPPPRESATTKNEPEPAAPVVPVLDSPQRSDDDLSDLQAKSGALAAEDDESYVWVNRFEREDRADSAAGKIQDLGLHAKVVSRHGLQGEFWVVVSGPFDSQRIPSVIGWLATQGFPNAHKLPNFLAGAKANQNR
jgi:serine/threonine protein kinase